MHVYKVARVCLVCYVKYGEHVSTVPMSGVSHGYCEGCLAVKLAESRKMRKECKVEVK